ncbi:MAG: tetratricopeptide repeat protein [Chloroflexota bacterium]|nr:tetratricopeptide repeat protein [Chloroflexota bacterium]
MIDSVPVRPPQARSQTRAWTSRLWAKALLAVGAALLLLTGALNVRALLDEERDTGRDQAVPITGRGSLGLDLDSRIATLQERLNRAPTSADATALGLAYLQKTRETGDPSYYPKAEELFNQAREAQPNDVEAMIGLGSLALARHDFAAALEWGEAARALAPQKASVHGVIGDAEIELGQYDAAIATFQTMVDLRPDTASFARVSYARELTGDLPGAIDAMERAAQAASANAANVAWTRVQLGNLHVTSGDLTAAERHYQTALTVVPGYAYGHAGMGRVAISRGDLEASITAYIAASATMPLPEFAIALGDLYTATGDLEKAADQYELVEAMAALFAENGVNTDAEMVLFAADHGRDLDQTLAVAEARYSTAPSIVAADALAWVRYQHGDYAGAAQASREAMRLGTRDPLMHFHAGLIAAATGDTNAASEHLRTALEINPRFSVRYAPVANTALESTQAGEELDHPIRTRA